MTLTSTYIFDNLKLNAMSAQKIKISKGLFKLINSDNVSHFRTYPKIFMDNPNCSGNYFEMFSKAQLVVIANSKI